MSIIPFKLLVRLMKITSSNSALIEYLLKYFSGVHLTEKEIIKMKEGFRSMKGDETLRDDDIFAILDHYRV